jgi:O-antigen ligase
MCAMAVFLATSETTKLALLAGLLVLGVARFAEPVARYALAAGWTVACLGVVPAVYLARSFELHNASWLQLSAQLRITQWNEIAQKVPEAPWLGVGANLTYDLKPIMQEAPQAVASWAGVRDIPHPHNAYLQTWYELGLVGVVLLILVGLLLLRNMGRLKVEQRPFAHAMFATAAVQIAFSYNIWQIWFLCLVGFTAAMFALGQTVLNSVDESSGSSLRL